VLALLDVAGIAARDINVRLQVLATWASIRNVALINADEGVSFEQIVAWPGIKGIFFRETSARHFVKGILAIFKGECWLPRKMLFAHWEQTSAHKRLFPAETTLLTPKEIDTLKLTTRLAPIASAEGCARWNEINIRPIVDHPGQFKPRIAARQRAAPRANGQLLFGIAQGASDAELRRRSIAELGALDFDGYALGGLAIGEERELMFETTAWAAELLPPDRPRYFMGIGDPEGVLEVIERGVDMFDCVLPTRTARTGSALTWEGRLNLRNARFARDPRPLDGDCSCHACSRFSRAYLRHLINQEELLGLRLLSLHNLRFLVELTANARAAIEQGRLSAYKAEALGRLRSAAA